MKFTFASEFFIEDKKLVSKIASKIGSGMSPKPYSNKQY